MNFSPVKIVACKAKPNYILWVRFDDGVEGEVDCLGVAAGLGDAVDLV